MLIMYRGRQYDTDHRIHVNELAQLLGITLQVAHLHHRNSPQDEVDRVLWERILQQVPGSLGGK